MSRARESWRRGHNQTCGSRVIPHEAADEAGRQCPDARRFEPPRRAVRIYLHRPVLGGRTNSTPPAVFPSRHRTETCRKPHLVSRLVSACPSGSTKPCAKWARRRCSSATWSPPGSESFNRSRVPGFVASGGSDHGRADVGALPPDFRRDYGDDRSPGAGGVRPAPPRCQRPSPSSSWKSSTLRSHLARSMRRSTAAIEHVNEPLRRPSELAVVVGILSERSLLAPVSSPGQTQPSQSQHPGPVVLRVSRGTGGEARGAAAQETRRQPGVRKNAPAGTPVIAEGSMMSLRVPPYPSFLRSDDTRLLVALLTRAPRRRRRRPPVRPAHARAGAAARRSAQRIDCHRPGAVIAAPKASRFARAAGCSRSSRPRRQLRPLAGLRVRGRVRRHRLRRRRHDG